PCGFVRRYRHSNPQKRILKPMANRYEHLRVRIEPYVNAYAYAFFALVWLGSVLIALVALVSIAHTLGTQTFSAIGLLGVAVCVIWGMVATFFVLLCL